MEIQVPEIGKVYELKVFGKYLFIQTEGSIKLLDRTDIGTVSKIELKKGTYHVPIIQAGNHCIFENGGSLFKVSLTDF